MVPRAVGGMEGRVAEGLRGALGPFGFEVHAFKVLTSGGPRRDVTRGDAKQTTSPSPGFAGAGWGVAGCGGARRRRWPPRCRDEDSGGFAAGLQPPVPPGPPAQAGPAPAFLARLPAGGTAGPGLGGPRSVPEAERRAGRARALEARPVRPVKAITVRPRHAVC